MNWKTTVILAVIVIAGAIYIQFVEKGRDTTKDLDAKGKKVFAVKDLSDHIGEIRVKREDGEFKFEKKGTGDDAAWRMVEPLAVRADKSEVKAIASELEDITVKNVMSPEGKVDLAEYGLDKPRATVTFKALGDEFSLLVGAKSPSSKNEMFVKRAESDKIYLVEDVIYEKVKKSKEEFRDKKVVNIEKNDVIGMQIAWGEAKDKASVTARKEKAQWSLTVPAEDYANKSKIETLIDHVKDLKIEKEDFVAETMGDAAKFGLDKPVLTAVVETDKEQKGEEGAEGKKLKFEIVFGKEAEGKPSKVYAKRKDEGAVFAVSDKILKDLTVEAVKDLRADDFGMFEKNDVNKLEISLASSNVVVEKAKRKDKDGKETDEKWKVIKPKEIDTEENEVTDFLSDLDGATIKEFVSDSPTDEELEKFGLKQAVATVTVQLKDGGGSLGFEVGKPHESEKDRFYARRAGRKSVYLVEKKDLHKNALAGYLLFKEREVIKFSKSDAQKVIVARGGTTVVATRKDDKWQLTQPVTGPGDESQTSDLLYAVNSLSAKTYVAEDPKDLAAFGLAEPAVKLTVEIKEKKKEGDEEKETERTVALLIGNKVPDQDEYYAKLAEGDNSNFVFTVTKDVFRKATAELHDREVVRITGNDVKKLVLKSKEETVTCERDEKNADKWKITTPKEAEGKKSGIEDVLDELAPLKAEKLASYKAVGPGELKPFGLDEPELTLTLNLKDGKEETIEIGKLTKEDADEYYWVRSAKKDGVYLVKKGDIDDLKKGFKDLAVVEEKKEEGAQPKTEGGETKTEEKQPEGGEKREEPKPNP